MHRARNLVAFSAALLLTLSLSVAFSWAGPPTEPILRLEMEAHAAPIQRIDVDPSGRILITASYDKTARIWDLATGRLLKILRPPLGSDNEGHLYSCALSPDGKLAAVGGCTGYAWDESVCIYLFDLSSGMIIHRLTGLPNVVNHLAFSRDGLCLAAAFGRGGIRIFNTSNWSLAFADSDYGEDSFGVEFSPKGNLVTTCFDGFVRLYDPSGQLVAKTNPPGGKKPYSASFSPDGTKVDVLRARDLGHVFSPNTKWATNDLSIVSWSNDGQTLYAGGAYVIQERCPIRCWSDSGRGEYREWGTAKGGIIGLKSLPGGGVVFGTGGPAWGAIEPMGQIKPYQGPAMADYKGISDKFRLSGDGSKVEFGLKAWGEELVRFNLKKGQLKEITGLDLGLVKPRTFSRILNVTEWENKYNPKLNNRPLELLDYEKSRSLALMPDNSGLLLGTVWFLRFYDNQGMEKWNVSAPSVAYAVNIAPNGKVCAAAFGDGTIRWYRVADGQELLALFPHKDKKRWVVWTPRGYYDCSPGAEELIGWHLNRGPDKEADFFPASRLREVSYRPDVVAKVLTTLDEDEAVKQANLESNRVLREADILQKLPPVVRIVSPHDGEQVSSSEMDIRYTLRSPSGEPVTSIRALVNGRPVAREQGTIRGNEEEQSRTLQLTIPARDCEISIIAENRYAASQPDTIRLRWNQARTGEGAQDAAKPKLFVLAIGVSDHQDKELRLGYAAKDAQDFSRVMAKQEGLLYSETKVRLLTDRQATRDNILDGLDWIKSQTVQGDVAMIFLAGHGISDPEGEYFFLPGNVDLNKLRLTGLPFAVIKKTVAALAGRVLVFMDTCHAVNTPGAGREVADINLVVNELSSPEIGAVAFSSSSGKQFSLEDPSWGNGAFTKALLEVLTGRTGSLGTDFTKGTIFVSRVGRYLAERVKELTRNRQTPTTARPVTIPDFPVALVK